MAARELECPDGLSDDHSAPRGIERFANPLIFLLLALIVAIGLSGALGGIDSKPLVLESPDARLVVDTRRILRNGEFFETRITASAPRPIGDLTIGLSSALWRDMTINTMIPAPTEEVQEEGLIKLSFGPLEAGKALEIKIDGQINPAIIGGSAGFIALFDGDRELARAPLEVRVWP